MSYITEIFERKKLQNITELLLNGVECIDINDKPYIEKIHEARDNITATFKQKFPNTDEFEGMMDEVFTYADVIEHAYMEIGLKCGASLVFELLSNKK